MFIDLKKVKDAGYGPRVHGNGFIQLDLTKRSRLNVWGDPEIPRQVTRTPIHDHTRDFFSQIIVGRLVSIPYTIESDEKGDYTIHESVTSEKEGTFLRHFNKRVRLIPGVPDIVEHGTERVQYTVKKGVFHEVFTDAPAATIMQRSGQATYPCRVLVREGVTPDNSFDRYAHDEGMLWNIIERTLALRGVR